MGPVALSVLRVPLVVMLFSWSPLGFVPLTPLIILVREQTPFVLPLPFIKPHWGQSQMELRALLLSLGSALPFVGHRSGMGAKMLLPQGICGRCSDWKEEVGRLT